MNEKEKHPFIAYLESHRDDRGTLAALRRGLGKPPGSVPEMFPYVIRFLPDRVGEEQEKIYYLVASLFAYHPSSTMRGNLGSHMRTTCGKEIEQATERRFIALLGAHQDDLPNYLRQAISYLKSKDQPVNWQQLFRDLRYWSHPDGFVQKQWAKSFWGYTQNTNQT
jgi:CRISPR system Cascade subunit CasB